MAVNDNVKVETVLVLVGKGRPQYTIAVRRRLQFSATLCHAQ